jgi:hypothetical protein
MKKIIIIALIFNFISKILICQPVTSLISNQDCKISYQIQNQDLILIIEDLLPMQRSIQKYAREGEVSDYRGNDGAVQIEFDNDQNNIYSEGDWGFFCDYQNTLKAYTIYQGFQTVWMHKLNKGFDKKTKTIYLNNNESYNEKLFTWKFSIPLLEIKNKNFNDLHIQVKIFRKLEGTTLGQFLELPTALDEFGECFKIPFNAKSFNQHQEINKLNDIKKKTELSKSKFLSKLDYNGIYIEMGASKFAKLTKTIAKNGVIVATRGIKPVKYYVDAPFFGTLDKSTIIPKCNKIILNGSEFQGDFLKYLSIHKIENLEALNLKINDGSFGDLQIRDFEYAGKFGYQYSMMREQPEKVYSLEVNKSDFKSLILLDFSTKTINEEKIEIGFTEELEKGAIVFGAEATIIY